MRIPHTVMIIATAILASPLAYGQGKGRGDSVLIPPTQRAVTPQSGTLSDLAGGGYADPNYVPPGTQSKKSTRHRVIRAPRAPTSRRFERYSAHPAFPYGYCNCDY